MALSKAVAFQVLLALTALGICLFPPSVFSQAPFYQNKTITIIQGRDPGATGDMRVKALLPFLQKHIPGNPTIVSEYIPGGGGRKAANHIYQSVLPDGLTIGNLSSGMVAVAVLGDPGVSYDLDKFFYLGSPFSSHHAYIIGIKEPRFVAGYGGAELDPALMRGEIDARATSADTLLRRNPEKVYLCANRSAFFHPRIDVCSE